jgi:type IV secretion system protein VirB9
MNRRSLVVAVALTLACAHSAFAETSPRPAATDARIQFLAYNEYQVYKVLAHYGFTVTIEFGADEVIETVSAGDTISWQIVPTGRRLFIKPMERDAHTNMVVVTTKYTYNFDLDAAEPKEVEAKEGETKEAPVAQTYLVKFRYAEATGVVNTAAASAPKTPATPASARELLSAARKPSDFNFDYRLKGDKEVMPTFVFDDGQFTYFQFADKRNQALPAIFLVDKDGNESVVNYRMEGEYMVVERLGRTFTLRGGESVACVSNHRPEDTVKHPQEKTDAPVFRDIKVGGNRG